MTNENHAPAKKNSGIYATHNSQAEQNREAVYKNTWPIMEVEQPDFHNPSEGK